MTDQDPQFGPLHRLDPAEPEEQPIGKLEPLDPESDDPSSTSVAAARSAPSRSRDGISLAVVLAVLLSLSSIAAIGGLVAISADSLAPISQPAVTVPIESAAPGPTIRVEAAPEEAKPDDPGKAAGESAAGPATPAAAVASVVAQAPAPPAPSESGDANDKEDDAKGGGGGSKGGNGGRLTPAGVGGAWCDAAPGTTCDAVVGGQPAALSSAESTG